MRRRRSVAWYATGCLGPIGSDPAVELDHLFYLVDPNRPEPGRLEALGLRESYRRDHTRQGTRNVCYCFDNAYIELLWVNDPEAARSPRIARTKLFERSTWRNTGTCPFGLSWRQGQDASVFEGETWDYRPPYLPPEQAIPVAADSDDAVQPMLFRSPGTTGPLDWPSERRGQLQHHLALATINRVTLRCPRRIVPSRALVEFCAKTVVDLCESESDDWSVAIDVAGPSGQERRFALPPGPRGSSGPTA